MALAIDRLRSMVDELRNQTIESDSDRYLDLMLGALESDHKLKLKDFSPKDQVVIKRYAALNINLAESGLDRCLILFSQEIMGRS